VSALARLTPESEGDNENDEGEIGKLTGAHGAGNASASACPPPLPLDILQERPYRRLVEYLGETRVASQCRCPPRDARPPHSEGAVGGAHARLGRRAAHSADLARCAAGEPGLALSRAPTTRAPRMDHRAMGNVGDKSPSAVYFYSNNVNGNGGIGWRIFGDNTTDHGNDLLAAGSALIIRKAANGTGLPVYWTNSPTY